MNKLTFPLRHAWALLPLIVLTMDGILAGLVFLPVPAHAAPDKIVYELSKECNASASECFAKGHHGNTFTEYVTNGQDSDNSWFEKITTTRALTRVSCWRSTIIITQSGTTSCGVGC